MQHLETTASRCTDVSVELHKLAEFVLVFTLSTSLIISSISAIVSALHFLFSSFIFDPTWCKAKQQIYEVYDIGSDKHNANTKVQVGFFAPVVTALSAGSCSSRHICLLQGGLFHTTWRKLNVSAKYLLEHALMLSDNYSLH